jgi:hypothetical protein
LAGISISYSPVHSRLAIDWRMTYDTQGPPTHHMITSFLIRTHVITALVVTHIPPTQ